MGDWLGYLELTAKAKTGVSSGALIGAVVGAVAAIATLIWLSITLFLWLAARFDDTVLAGLVLSAIFLAIALIAIGAAALSRRRARERAEAALAARRAASTLFSPSLLNPSMLTAGLEIGRAIGWRRIAALAGVVLLVSGVAREWTAHKSPPEDDPADEPPAG